MCELLRDTSLKSCSLAAVLAMRTQLPSAGAVRFFFFGVSVTLSVLPCDLLTTRPEVAQ